jgi:asparagine synthase (glutamine-hydrolysing)
MSGGLDSPSVAALAARMLAPQQLKTFSFVFDEILECNERENIDLMVERWGLQSIQIPCDDLWPYKNWPNWLFNPSYPVQNAYFLMLERAYSLAKEQGVRTLLSGGFGDALYIGGKDWLVDLLEDGHWGEAAREFFIHLRHLGLPWMFKRGHLQPVIRHFIEKAPFWRDLHRESPPPIWLTSSSAKHLSKPSQADHLSHERNSHLIGANVSKDVANWIFDTSHFMVEVRDPYKDRRLVEFVMSLPAYQLYYRGYFKRILRKAMKGLLPEAIRTAYARTSLLPFYFYGVKKEQETLQEYFGKPEASWHAYVKKDWVMEHWNTPVIPEKDGLDVLTPWRCLWFEAWYKKVFEKLG